MEGLNGLGPIAFGAKGPFLLLHVSMGEVPMPSVLDVASFILNQNGAMTTWKLQKLVYYCQAWSLVWDEEPLFPEQIEAWANGPVVRELYDVHRGRFKIGPSDVPGDARRLSESQVETIRAVLDFYGNKTSQWLVDHTHSESPWKNARVGVPETERSDRVILLGEMAEYYGGL